MDNQFYRQQAIEIDLKDIIWKLLTQWKAILLVSLIMALLACGTKHMKDVRSYNAQIAAQNEAAETMSLSVDEQISKVMDTLPEEDRGAVDLVVSEKEWLAIQKEYINNSILMRTDSTNQRVLKLMFDIDSTQKSELPVLLHNYAIFQYSDEVICAIRPLIDESAEDKYIGELFYTEGDKTVKSEIEETGAALDINLVLPEEADAEAVAKAIDAAFSKHSEKIQAKYPHTISLAGNEVQNIYHTKNVEKHNNIFNVINTLDNTVKTDESLLSDTQIAAVKSIMAIKSAESATEEAAAETPESEMQTPGWSKKFAVMGFIAGVFIYALLYVVWLIIKGNLISNTNVEKNTKTRLLGEIYYDGSYEGMKKFLHSKAVEKIHHRGKDDPDKEIEHIANSIKAILDHSGNNTALILNAARSEAVAGLENVISSLVSKAKYKDVSLEVINVSNDINENDLRNTKNAVIVVSDNTNNQHLKELMTICSEFDVKLIGCMFTGEQ